VARSGIVPLERLKHCIEEEFSNKAKLIPLNMKAVDAGVKAAGK
jgi:2-oxoglutarate ferredoxin oxidoreductase subunit gamma